MNWELVNQLSEWIETNPIAENLVDTMEEIMPPEKVTFDNAKNIYLDFLYTELTDGLKGSAINWWKKI